MTAVRLAAVLLLSVSHPIPGGRATQPPVPPAAEPPAPFGAVQIGTTQFRQRGWHSRVFLADGGKTMVVVSEGPVVRFWDVESGARLDEITLKGNYHAAAFAPAGNRLAVVGTHSPTEDIAKSEGLLTLIDTAARKQLHAVGLPGNMGGNHQKVCVSADGRRVFVEYEGDVRVIDGTTGDELKRHKGRINAGTLAVTADGKLVAFGRNDVFLWKWEADEEPRKFTTIYNFGTELMEFSPDGKTLHVGPHGNMVTSWDVATGKQTGSKVLETLPGRLAFSPDGKTLAIPSHPSASRPPADGQHISLVDTTTWNEVGRIPVGRLGLAHVSWSADGSRIAGVTDYVAMAWDVTTRRRLGPNRPGHESMVAALAFAPDGTLFTASDDHTIRSWPTGTGGPGLELGHDYWVRGIAVSPDGSLVVGSSLRNDLRVWDARTGQQRFKLLGHGQGGGRRVVRFTADGTRLVSWGDDAFVRVWDVRTGKLLAENSTRPAGEKNDPDDPFAEHMRFIRAMTDAVDISPDGATLALSEGTGIRLLDPMTGKERQTVTVGETGVGKLAFSPDGKRLLIALNAKRIEIKLPNGRTRISSEDTYPVMVWDVAAGKLVWATSGEGTWPGLAYSPDGTRVALASNVWQGPSRLRAWDAATGKELGRLELPRPGHHLAFSADGKRLAVSLQDTTALVYDLDVALKEAGKK